VIHEELVNEIMKITPKIRFVGIYRKGDYSTKLRGGLQSYLNEEETKESMKQAIIRMNTRKLLAHKIGKTHYAIAKYDKISRITIPFGNDGLILITTESDAEYDPIGEKILDLRNSFEESLS
jgi:hypothetical protein